MLGARGRRKMAEEEDAQENVPEYSMTARKHSWKTKLKEECFMGVKIEQRNLQPH